MLMGMAWVTIRRQQVRVDIICARYSPKVKILIDAILNVYLFFPLFIMLLRRALTRVMYSYTIQEFSEVGSGGPSSGPTDG